ncbi:hypothetical protein FSB73_02945 [Arachidicoccus ginsenosidivorans]|uniref:Uncharacterized protein n=1 Tax=Arachidicoccus ginsenosidivorans TaxID=496057 RepID=A0A5B8VIG7_9BACT|nr:hypothetical protein [Arachidicoccus ginsenosidivorans]QEC70795.1 hypothetical protein FSB73_02945 [Arachidicoccus ginsenosidivorans]
MDRSRMGFSGLTGREPAHLLVHIMTWIFMLQNEILAEGLKIMPDFSIHPAVKKIICGDVFIESVCEA